MPLLIHGSTYFCSAEILIVLIGAVMSITSLTVSLKVLKFPLQLPLFNRQYQSTAARLFLISHIFSSFKALLSNISGVLSSIFVCLSRHMSGRWSGMFDIRIPESKFLWNFSLINILSINVAKLCVILLGLGIAGYICLSNMLSKPCELDGVDHYVVDQIMIHTNYHLFGPFLLLNLLSIHLLEC